MSLELEDEEEEDLLSWLDQTYEFIEEAIDHGGNVLVHCTAGISRYIEENLFLHIKKKLNYFSQDRPV